jgi:uncharacterized membrane protein
MAKKIALLFFTPILFFEYFSVVNAQIFSEEAIVSYTTNIVVNIDNSIDVTEKIIYNTGSNERHGIYRDIYTLSSQKRKMSIKNITVTDENGNPYQFQISNYNDNIRIKIGDPNKTFIGEKTYIINYHAETAVAQFKEFDEIYWNATGNEWNMPIYYAQASVTLPINTKAIQYACYYGPKGSTNKCELENIENETYTFKAPKILYPYEGLTIAVGFPKGIVSSYPHYSIISIFFNTYEQLLIAIILPILTLIFSLLNWYKKGRDDRKMGVIVPQYDVPEDLTPMEVSGIVNERITDKEIPAEIIYLATKGYLKIQQLEERFIELTKSTDYELIKLKDFSDLKNDFDRKLLDKIFGPNKSIKLSDLKYNFYKHLNLIIISALDSLLNKGYYKNIGRMKTGKGRIFLIIFMSIWASGFFGIIFTIILGLKNPIPLAMGIFFSIIIYGIISHFSPAKTEKGVAIKEYLLGLKEYLQIAEKDRLKFHNAPEKKPEIFEKLLPYAMVLGVADIWAKEFEGIYKEPPSWYSDPSGTTFSATAFTHAMNNFESSVGSTLSSSLSSGGSGSGGGGSSGGGGGGGGGGSW